MIKTDSVDFWISVRILALSIRQDSCISLVLALSTDQPYLSLMLGVLDFACRDCVPKVPYASHWGR